MVQVACVVALLMGVALAAGCEQRVVGTRNAWVGSQYERIAPPKPQPKRDGPIEAVGRGLSRTGDFLFGWMGGGKKKAAPPPTTIDSWSADLNSRMSQPSTQKYGGE